MSAFAIDIEANRPGDSARSFDGVEHERKAEKETAPSELDRDDDGPRHSLEYGSDLKDDPRAHAETWENKWGVLGKTIAFLIRHGCEARGISPVPVEERRALSRWNLLPQATLWAGCNTNLLAISAGIIGPELFKLPLKSCIAVIVTFNFLSALPVAYFATFGPKFGMRQMVLSRYAYGYWLVRIPAIFNAFTAIGFLALTAILGGQTLSISSNSHFGWSVGIVIVGVLGVFPSFLGVRALHLFSVCMFPLGIAIFLAVLGLAAPSFSLIESPANTLAVATTVGGVLGYGSSIIGFTATYTGFSADFSTYLPPDTPSFALFVSTFIGLYTPMVLLQILGAALELASGSIEHWMLGFEEDSVGGLLGAVVGSSTSQGGRFLMVMLALNLVANVAPTVYSVGLSLQVAAPWLLRVPRYVLAIAVTVAYVPIALALSSNFSSYLSNFLYVISYWIALYIPPILFEAVLFRRSASTSFDPRIWDDRKKLPIGWAALAGWIAGIPAIVAGASQAWWVGWAARQIDGGLGDIGFFLGFAACSIVFIPARYLERRYTGR